MNRAAGHRAGVWTIPAARLAVWACTCGHGRVWEYGQSVDEDFAARVAGGRAAGHVALTGGAGTP